MYSHCELSLPSAGDQLSELDHFEDGREFLTRDLLRYFDFPFDVDLKPTLFVQSVVRVKENRGL